MKKIIRAFALVLAIVMMVSVFGGCHKKGEVAYTIGGREFTSAMYSCVLYTAATNARGAIYSFVSENNGDTSKINYNEYKFDEEGNVSATGTKTYTEFVEAETLKVLRQYAAVLNLMEEKGLSLDEESRQYAEIEASYYWYVGCSYSDYYRYSNSGYDVSSSFTPYSVYFEPNGVAFETYALYMTYEFSYNHFFYELYGEGGEKEIPETDLFTYLDEHYVVADSFSYSLVDDESKDLTEEEKTVLLNEAKAFVERLNNGESFDVIFAEWEAAEKAREDAKKEEEDKDDKEDAEDKTEEEDKEEDKDEDKEEDKEESDEYEPAEYTGIFGDDESDYPSSYFEDIKALEIGKALYKEDTESKVLVVFSRRDNHEEDGFWLDYSGTYGVMRDNIIYTLKFEEYEAMIDAAGGSYEATANKHALRPFTVKKLKFDIEQ